VSDITESTTTTAGAGTTPGADTGTGTQPGTTAAERTFTQAEVNAFLAEQKRKDEQRAKDAEARARQQEAEKAAAAAGEWQTVAEQRKAAADEAERRAADAAGRVEHLEARLAAQAAVVEKLIKAQLAELPEAIRELAPGGDDLTARLEWVAKARKAAATQPAATGTPAGPRGTGAPAVVQPNQLDRPTARAHGLDYTAL
jgi:uncharacterized coiled-coil protein SlyX